MSIDTLIISSVNLQTKIADRLATELRLNREVAMDNACEIIHMMMESGVVNKELSDFYFASEAAD